jgi:hypothetical protein
MSLTDVIDLAATQIVRDALGSYQLLWFNASRARVRVTRLNCYVVSTGDLQLCVLARCPTEGGVVKPGFEPSIGLDTPNILRSPELIVQVEVADNVGSVLFGDFVCDLDPG